MHISELKTSKFLKQADVGAGTLVTITGVSQENVAQEGAEPEMKWCLHVAEFERPLVINSTNGALLAQITGSEESDGWIGKKVVLYNDKTVSFGGKLTGGIRIRAAKIKPQAKAGAKPAPAPVPADAAVTDENGVEEVTDTSDLPF